MREIIEGRFSSWEELMGRRTKELYVMLGIVLPRQMENPADEASGRTETRSG